MINEIMWSDRAVGPLLDQIEIGFRGGPIYRINRFKLHKAIYEGKVKDTPEDVLKFAIKESQYVEFEEVNPKDITP